MLFWTLSESYWNPSIILPSPPDLRFPSSDHCYLFWVREQNMSWFYVIFPWNVGSVILKYIWIFLSKLKGTQIESYKSNWQQSVKFHQMLVILVFCVTLIQKIIKKFNMTIMNVLKYVIWQHDLGRMTLQDIC